VSVARHVLTILAVSDLARAGSFYDAAFGWPRTVDAPAYIEMALPGGQRLGLYERRSFGRNTGAVPFAAPAGALAPCELYLHVDDLEAAIERLERAGARPLSARARRDWGDEVAYFADPDGIVIAVAAASGGA
jgi:predicted enzyme related to lactoylglutathione lyase